MNAQNIRGSRKSPMVGIIFYVGQWQTLKAEGEARCWTGKINEWIEGRWSGGQEGICGNGGTENVHLEKRKRQIKEDMPSEYVAREVIVSLIII